ncbi:MAG: hypothetical protein A2X35_02715 [Elusimicrobia bacterium GWA2_61_42]|nr:MAG: hypothetical protein A2X35_02715 [Elusimicrobia bacterium GWA2_61_42]OGR78071.1 MAG: hypothetical protein A2X38_01790 [Elusimicrobia bacterium GWC2_61_25]
MSRVRNFFLTVLLPVGCAAALFWRDALFQPGRALLSDVLLRYFYPMHEFTRRSLAAWDFPLWNPHISAGTPFLASLQPALCYPFTYAALLLDFPGAAAFSVLLHTALAAAFMHLFVSRLGLSLCASLAAAAVYAFNGFFAMHYSFPNQMAAYAWLPAIAYFLKRYDETPDARFFLAAVLALALQLVSGHPLFAAYSGLCLLVLKPFIFRAVTWKRFLLLPAAAAALAAAQLLPTFFLTLGSQRLADASFAWGTAYSVAPLRLLSMFAPLWNRYLPAPAGDPHIETFYIGALAAAAALWALTGRRRKEAAPFFAVALAGLALALGSHLFLYEYLWNYFPPARLFRFPAQALCLPCFGLAVCAAYGTDMLKAPRARALALLGVYLELLVFSAGSIKTVDAALYSAPVPSPAAITKSGAYDRVVMAPNSRRQRRHTGRSELEAWLNFKDTLLPNTAMALGLYDADNFEELKPAAHEKILARLYSSPFSPWIDLLSVKHMVSFFPLPPEKYAPAAGAPPYLFRNKTSLPRAYFTDTALCRPREEVFDAVEKTYAANSPLYGAVILEKGCPAATPGPETARPALTAARITAYGPDSVAIDCAAPAEGWLVLSDTYFRGWKASVNGTPAEILRADYNLRAVKVKKGFNSVKFSYAPPEFYAGLLLTLLSLAGFVFAWFQAGRRQKAQNPRP